MSRPDQTIYISYGVVTGHIHDPRNSSACCINSWVRHEARYVTIQGRREQFSDSHKRYSIQQGGRSAVPLLSTLHIVLREKNLSGYRSMVKEREPFFSITLRFKKSGEIARIYRARVWQWLVWFSFESLQQIKSGFADFGWVTSKLFDESRLADTRKVIWECQGDAGLGGRGSWREWGRGDHWDSCYKAHHFCGGHVRIACLEQRFQAPIRSCPAQNIL